MRVLVVDDEVRTAALLRRGLTEEGYAVDVAGDARDAIWRATEFGYDAVVLDVLLPEMDGFEVCRALRAKGCWTPVLMLTARADVQDRVRGLDAGADDYLTKPFDADELRARVHVGSRVLALQQRLAERVAELQQMMANVKHLRGLLPICSYCKRIRSDSNYWEQVESYISDHTEAQFSHGICPCCYKKVMAELGLPAESMDTP